MGWGICSAGWGMEWWKGVGVACGLVCDGCIMCVVHGKRDVQFVQFAEFGVDYSSDTMEFVIPDCSECLALTANIGLTGIPDTLLEDMEGVELTLNSSTGNFVGFESIVFPTATQVTITDDDGRLMVLNNSELTVYQLKYEQWQMYLHK